MLSREVGEELVYPSLAAALLTAALVLLVSGTLGRFLMERSAVEHFIPERIPRAGCGGRLVGNRNVERRRRFLQGERCSLKPALFYGPKQPLVIEDVEIDKPLDREVLLRTVATGVCHSDLHFVDGYYSFPAPAVLGHEAAGIVEEVGKAADYGKTGDHDICCLSV